MTTNFKASKATDRQDDLQELPPGSSPDIIVFFFRRVARRWLNGINPIGRSGTDPKQKNRASGESFYIRTWIQWRIGCILCWLALQSPRC